MDKKTALDLLQINKEKPTKKEVNSAFRELAKDFHPDHNKGKQSFTKMLQQLNKAREVLLGNENKEESKENNRKYISKCEECRIPIYLTPSQYWQQQEKWKEGNLSKTNYMWICTKCAEEKKKKANMIKFWEWFGSALVIIVFIIVSFVIAFN